MSEWPKNVRRKDLRIEYFNATGHRQNRRDRPDKRRLACWITHIPTELYATGEETCRPLENRKCAFRKLVDQLAPLMKAAFLENEPRELLTGEQWSFNDALEGGEDDDVLISVRGVEL